MKLTESHLRKIVKQELKSMLNELQARYSGWYGPSAYVRDILTTLEQRGFKEEADYLRRSGKFNDPDLEVGLSYNNGELGFYSILNKYGRPTEIHNFLDSIRGEAAKLRFN